MIPELGHYALVLALVMALAQASLPMVGAARGIRPWMQLARPAALAQFAFVAFAFVALMQAMNTPAPSTVMVGLGPTIHEFRWAPSRCGRQTRGWSCQARP